MTLKKPFRSNSETFQTTAERTERGSPARFFAFLGWLVAGDYTAGQLESERLTGARDTDEPGEPPAYM